MKIKVTSTTKDVLSNYNLNKLLTQAIPENYFEKNSNQLQNILKIYNKKMKPEETISITPTKSITELQAISLNLNLPFSILFNYLIECVCDLSKINTIKIDRALDFYYNAVNTNKTLFSEILNQYAQSIYYDEEVGLDEEAVVAFLLYTSEDKELMNRK